MLLLASAEGPDFVQVAPVEVEPLLVDALGRWSHAPRRWALETVEEATVLGDRDRLALALDALLENAVAHTDIDGHIQVSAALEDAGVVLAVADSGCGIPAEDLGRIFDRFARVDPHRSRAAGGVGLGLTIVKAIAEAHHGSVRVQSTVGRARCSRCSCRSLPSGPGRGRPASRLGHAQATAARKARR